MRRHGKGKVKYAALRYYNCRGRSFGNMRRSSGSKERSFGVGSGADELPRLNMDIVDAGY